MATKAFDYALTEIDLVGKAVNALQGLVSNTAARQRAIRDLQILEAVLRGAEGVSIASASEETLRNLHYCSQFCRPPLNRFLRSLKELEPDFCHASARGESLVETNREPVWATRLESEVALLQRSVGTGLRAIDLLLRVEAMRCDMAANTTLPGDLQRIIEALQEHLHGPGKRHVGPGHHYNNIQNSGGYSHYGDKYFFNGAPPVALIEAMAKKLDGTVGMLQIGQVLSIEEDPGDMLPRGDALARVVNDNTPGPFANEQPLAPQTTQSSAMELTKLLLQCLLELSRTKLNALLAMLLWTIPDFRAFVRSLTVITRLPSMLLHDNITLVDALNREVSLPYQWFREWPHMLAHLQYEFKGTPGEAFVSESRFDLFRDSASSRLHSSSRIPSDQWEESVSPGIRVVMSMRLDADKFSSHVCPSCKRLWMTARGTNEWSKCKYCGKFVLAQASSTQQHAFARYAPEPRQPSIKTNLKTGQAGEEEDLRHFSRVHGPALLTKDRSLARLWRKVFGSILNAEWLRTEGSVAEEPRKPVTMATRQSIDEWLELIDPADSPHEYEFETDPILLEMLRKRL